jgi:pimeloyl-ACP methyl ester carboxylesterase
VIGALLVAALTTVTALPHTRTGQGPAIVLVHGLTGDRHTWDDVARELAKSFTVVAVDLPGHGDAPAQARFDADEIAARIVETARQEKLGRIVVVGHSLGGFITAHLHDPSVAGIVLVDIGIGGLFSGEEEAQVRDGLAKDRDALLTSWFAALSKPGTQRERVTAAAKKLADATIRGYVHVMATQSTKTLHAPALVMASPLLLPRKKPQADELAAVGYDPKSVHVERFDRSMHWLMWDEPDKFVKTLSEFASRTLR